MRSGSRSRVAVRALVLCGLFQAMSPMQADPLDTASPGAGKSMDVDLPVRAPAQPASASPALDSLLIDADLVVVADVAALGRPDSKPDASGFGPSFQLIIFDSRDTLKGRPIPILPVKFTLPGSPFLTASHTLDPNLFYPRETFILLLREVRSPRRKPVFPQGLLEIQFWHYELLNGWVPDPENQDSELQFVPLSGRQSVIKLSDENLNRVKRALNAR